MRDFDGDFGRKKAQELKITIFPSCEELGSRVVSKESPKPKEPVSEASQYSDDDDWQFKPKESQNSTKSSEKISLIDAISALEKRFDTICVTEKPKLQSEESEEPESEESKESSEELPNSESEKSAKEISSETSEEVWIEKPSESSSYDVVVRDIQDILNLKNLETRLTSENK